MLALFVKVVVLTVAVITTAPVPVGVKVAVYVPSPLSVTAVRVPDPVLEPPIPTVTASPPAERSFPLASINWMVMDEVSTAPRLTAAGFGVIVDVAALAGPGVTVTVGNVDVTATVLIVALIVVAVPAVTPVNVAV